MTLQVTQDLHIELPAFQGPLDLLLHLIQKHELNIIDLPMAFVTERYLEYLSLMQHLNLDVASEYLLMAATLTHIKSKTLLPVHEVEEESEGESGEYLDPRAELIRRLLEYQKYKVAAEQLASRSVVGRDTFLRGADIQQEKGPAPLSEIGLFALLDAFKALLAHAKVDMTREITAEQISIQERITDIAERLRMRRRARFEELFTGGTALYELVVTFLAVLEMVKRRLARVYQADLRSPIHIELIVVDVESGENSGTAESSSAEEPKA